MPSLEEALHFYHEDDRALVAAAFTRAFEEGEGYDLEVRFTTAQGNRLWVQTIGECIVVEGEVVRLQGIIRDVTEHRSRDRALREQGAQLRAVFDSMSDYQMLLDREHRVRLVNRVEPGFTMEQVIGSRLYEFSPPDDLERVRGLLDAVIREGTKRHWESNYERPDGAVVTFHTVATPVVVAGEVTGSVVSARDVSDRLRLEEEKEALERQYHQAQKMESIGRLAGGVAHDFNNLLTVINSYAEFVLEDLRDGDPLKADIDEILQAGHRATGLTRQLLAFGRKQVMTPEVLDLNDIVRQLDKMLRRLIGEDLEFRSDLAEDLGRVSADPGQVEQVLMNLAVNARDAMPRGGRLTIETANVELDEDYVSQHPDAKVGPHVMLTVKDDGEGMTPEVAARMFEPFFTTKEAHQGTGLGLSMVYGIVKQSGGSIEVQSSRGRGSTFTTFLPRVETPASPLRRDEAPRALGGQETVLVVEDEAAVRNLTRRILASAGYTVITAANAGEALLECERVGHDISLLLTDVVMPKMSGTELVARLTDTCPDIRALYMSGYAAGSLASRDGVEASMPLLNKPFSPNQLLTKVRLALDTPRPGVTSASGTSGTGRPIS